MCHPRQNVMRAAPTFATSYIDAHIGSRLRKARIARGMTTGQLALICGISELDINRAETGILRLPPLVLVKLIKTLGVRLVDLMPH